MRLHPLLMATTLALAGCGQPVPEPAPSWAALGLPGKTLELIDDDKVESYRFEAEGLVVATRGTRAALTAPLLYWRAERDRLAISPDANAGPLEVLHAVAIQGNRLQVRRQSGEQAQFTLTASRN